MLVQEMFRRVIPSLVQGFNFRIHPPSPGHRPASPPAWCSSASYRLSALGGMLQANTVPGYCWPSAWWKPTSSRLPTCLSTPPLSLRPVRTSQAGLASGMAKIKDTQLPHPACLRILPPSSTLCLQPSSHRPALPPAWWMSASSRRSSSSWRAPAGCWPSSTR